MDVSAAQVRAFRIAQQGLATRADGHRAVLSQWAVQDSPPGAAATALLARTDELDPDWMDDRSVVALYNPRTATAVVPSDEVAAYGTAFLPPDETALRAIIGTALPDRQDGFEEAARLATEAISEALDGRTLSRDDLHGELRQRLPRDMLPWCAGCKSHHARRGLLVIAGLNGRLCIAGKAGRQPAFARTDQHVGWPPPEGDPGAELTRRYLTIYGPSTPAHFAQWAGIGTSHARQLWARVEDELTEVKVGGRKAWLREEDLDTLKHPPRAEGIRLIGPGDPLLLARDREVLVEDEATRKEVWKAIGGAGVVITGGDVAGVWRARKKGTKLSIETNTPLDGVVAEAQRLAFHRGATRVVLAAG